MIKFKFKQFRKKSGTLVPFSLQKQIPFKSKRIFIIYGNKNIQPQITSDFMISSNHFYVFILTSVIGFLTFKKVNQIKILKIYLILLSVILEIFHIVIPERTFQWPDLFGNLLGVFLVILIKNLINKYGLFKK